MLRILFCVQIIANYSMSEVTMMKKSQPENVKDSVWCSKNLKTWKIRKHRKHMKPRRGQTLKTFVELLFFQLNRCKCCLMLRSITLHECFTQKVQGCIIYSRIEAFLTEIVLQLKYANLSVSPSDLSLSSRKNVLLLA